jgi:hypothetical protein
MKWYGSVQNRLAEQVECKDEIVVGMYATEYLWSDRHAWEVIKVTNQNRITLRRLKAIRTDKNYMSDCQDYRFESNLNGEIAELKRTPKGKWNRLYTYTDENGKERINHKEKFSVSFGEADEYYDYSF